MEDNEVKSVHSSNLFLRETPQVRINVEDGILTVTMPKAEPKQKVTKAIEVS